MPEASREGSEVMQLLGAEHVRSALVSLAGFCGAAFKDLPCEQLADHNQPFIPLESHSLMLNVSPVLIIVLWVCPLANTGLSVMWVVRFKARLRN